MSASASLWRRLVASGLAAGELPPAQDAGSPWYVRLMLAIAGLIAAGFLIGFVGVALHHVWESTPGSLVAGSAMVGAAFVLFIASRSDFSSMFGFAVSVAGQALLGVGVFKLLDGERSAAPWAVMAAIEAGLAVLMPNYLHRVASAFAAPLFLTFALAMHGFNTLVTGAAAAAIAAIWLHELGAARLRAVLAPIGYGLTLALVYIQAELRDESLRFFTGARTSSVTPWLGDALGLASLVAVVLILARRAGWPLREPRMLLALAMAAAIGAVSFKAPGVAAGLMIVLLGFANGNRVLTGAGIAALVFYIAKYYYQLDVTLLVKSGVLAATAVVLLAARWFLLNIVMPRQAEHA